MILVEILWDKSDMWIELVGENYHGPKAISLGVENYIYESLKFCINLQKEPYISDTSVLYSALLHISAVYISRHPVGTSSQ